jgi:hypothetical protein
MSRGMGTSLSYTSRTSERIEAKAEAGRHVVVGMPYRRQYAADLGWDELMLAYVPKVAPRMRQGAAADRDLTGARRVRYPSGSYDKEPPPPRRDPADHPGQPR